MSATSQPVPQRPQRGLECPRCGCQHFRVVYTRPALGGRIMRRRECRHCGRRVTTYERTQA
jgi:transcriptional regulator NrdR family protein